MTKSTIATAILGAILAAMIVFMAITLAYGYHELEQGRVEAKRLHAEAVQDLHELQEKYPRLGN